MNSKLKTSKKHLALWALAWVATTALVTFGFQFLWESKIITVIAIVLSLAVGLGMVLANRKFINDGDELQRKIQLESMALTLGLSIIVGLAYSQLDTTNLIASDAEISSLVLFIGITYFVCILFNSRKYS
ncbi:MAG TPA: hypothetical protein ENH91_10655 [Leeuwenhoekiella sp.]|nr:hypothetical protein [Leeuwenhoekiella sp.]